MKNKFILDKWLIVTILAAILMNIFEFYPAIFKGLYISGDNRIEMFPLYRFYDKGLFPGWDLCDIIFRYLPMGFKSLCFILSKFMSLYSITLFLPFFLSLATISLVYGTAKFITKSGLFSFFISCIFLLLYLSSDLGRGGTLRAFGFLFIAGFLFFMLRRQRIGAYLAAIISLWFFPISAGIFLLMFFLDAVGAVFSKETGLKDKRIILASFIFFVVLLGSALRMHPLSPFAAMPVRQYNQEEIERMPEFGPQGTAEPSNRLIKNIPYIFSLRFVYDQLFFIENYNRNLAWVWPLIFICSLICAFVFKGNSGSVIFLAAILTLLCSTTIYFKILDVYAGIEWLLLSLSVVIIVFFGREALKIPAELWNILFSGIAIFLILYLMPHQISASLHYPARQMGLVLPFFLVFFFGYNFYRFFPGKASINNKYFLLISAVLLLIFYLGAYNRVLFFAKDKELYQYLSALPKDITVAGQPYEMDFIPFFAKRKVLACNEIDPSFGPEYWPKYKERTYDTFKALYAHSLDEFKEFCRKYEAENIYFVVNKYYLSKDYLDSPKLYFEPFGTYLHKISKDRDFFFANLSEDRKVFISNDIFVVKCGDFLFR